MSRVALSADRSVSGATGGTDIGVAAPLVLLVHGAGMNRTVWSLQTRWLAHHGCAALAVDLPGHGTSEEPERSSIDDYADWLADVVRVLDREIHVVGHSMGSFVALETAVRADLASITLVGAAVAMPVHPVLLSAAERNDPLAAQLMSGWAFAHHSRTGPHPSPGNSMVGATQALIAQAKPGVLYNDLAMCAAYDAALTAAASVTTPTHFLLGADDRMTPRPKAQPLIDAIAGSSVRTLAGVGHMIQIEAPAATRAAIAMAVRQDAGT